MKPRKLYERYRHELIRQGLDSPLWSELLFHERVAWEEMVKYVDEQRQEAIDGERNVGPIGDSLVATGKLS